VEIIDFLSLSRRRVLVLVGVPLLAAASATAMVLTSNDTFSATATVSAPALVGGAAGNQYTGSQAVSQFVAAFQATAQGPAVRQAVSDSAHVAVSDVANNLTVSQVGASSTMTLTYTSQNRKAVEPVLAAVTRLTLQTMFGSQVALAETQISNAKDDLAKANAAIVAWEQHNGMVAPDQIYQARIDQINSLLQQQTTLRSNGNPVGAAAVGATIASTRAELVKFAPRLAQYQILVAGRDAATAGLTQAQQNLLSARSQSDAADPAKVAFISGEHLVSEAPTLLTTVLPITGAGVFVAVVLIAIMELGAASRSARRSGAPDDTAQPSADVDEGRSGKHLQPSTEHRAGHSPVPLVEHGAATDPEGGRLGPDVEAGTALAPQDEAASPPGSSTNRTLTATRE
jgi:hypothetical protein